MNILLLSIQGPNLSAIEEPGLGSIGAILNREGHNVKTMQVFHRKEYMNDIKAFNPDIIGASMYDNFFVFQIEELKKISENMPNTQICIGGYTASYNGEDILKKYDFVDFIIFGEGEIPFVDLINAVEINDNFYSVGGLIFRDNEKIITNKRGDIIQELDNLPFSNRDILNASGINLVQMSTSRGCTGNCTFCCSSGFWRDKEQKRIYRSMSPKRVVDEIEHIIKIYNKNRFAFNDNSYEDPNNNLGRQREIAKEILARKLNIGYNVNYKVGFYKHADRDFINLLIKSGMCSVFLGVEAGNNKDLALYNKRCTVEDNSLAIEFFRTFPDLDVIAGFINFNPYTDVDRLYENIEFLEKHNYANDLSNFMSKFVPYKGVKLFDKIAEEGLLRGSIYEGGYYYIYANSDMAYLEKHLNKVVVKYEILNRTRYYCGKVPSILIQLKKDAFNTEQYEAYKLITNFQEEYKLLLAQLNHLCAEWLKKLIRLLELGWNEDLAEDITHSHMNDYKIVDTYNLLRKKRNKLYAELLKLDKTYATKF